MKQKITFLVFLLIVFPFRSLEAYDDEITHRDLTIEAVENSILKDYLPTNLGTEFSQGYRSIINGKRIIDWIKDGSIAEDSPMCRPSNHFHNPLLPWDQSFMSDDTTTLGLMIRDYCNLRGWPYDLRKSSVTWGTGYLSPNGPKVTLSNQNWGWDDTRNYYYLTLTSTSNTDRETYFAKTFQALGQVLHLIEDGAQPAHVRNDFTSHLTFTGVESYLLLRWIGSQFEHYVKNNPGLVTGSNPEIPSFTRLTDFWDTDQYIGMNPSTSLSIGITEFTNANYFSDETIPNNNPTIAHAFPYPQVSSENTQICEDYAPGSSDIRRYISRKDRGPCPDLSDPNNAGTADHFATLSLVNEEYLITNNNISTLKLLLDDNVHNTYAKEVLPRAVGYSAALINYFFRGQINMEKDPNDSSKYIIKNLSNEPMSGAFSLYYDDKNGNRYTVQGGSWNISMNAGSQSVPVTFTEPTEAKEKGKYILVFQGILGNEEGAVIGRVVTLSRPLYLRITLPDGTVVYWDIEDDKEVKLVQAKPVSESPFLPRFYNTGKIDVYTQVVGSRIEGPHFKVSSSCYAVETDDGLIRYTGDYLYQFLAGVTQPFLKRSISFSGGGSEVQTRSWRDPDSFEYRLSGCSVSGETGSITEIITNGGGITMDLHDLLVIERSGAQAYFGLVGSDTTTKARYFPGGLLSSSVFVPSDDIRELTQNFEVFSVTNGVIKNRKVTSNIVSYRYESKTWLEAPVSDPWNLPASTCWVGIPGSVYYGTPTKYYLCDSTAKHIGSRAAVDFQNSYVTKNSYHPTINWVVTKYGVNYYNYEWQNGEWVWVGPERKPEIHIRVDTFEYNGTDLSPVSDRLLLNLSIVFQNNPKATLNGFVEGTLQE